MEIPYTQLSDPVLDAVIEEFITREGTDYGHQETSLAKKVEQVRRQLAKGDVFLSFDPLTESCQLLPSSLRNSLDSLDETNCDGSSA